MFLRDKDWAQVVKTNHFPPSLSYSGGTEREKRVSAQAKPISEVIEDFEQSLEGLRPSTRRVYVAGARAAIRAAGLELWESPSATELLASIGKSPTEVRDENQRAGQSPVRESLCSAQANSSASDNAANKRP